MDISGAQLNAAAISAVNAQLQVASQQTQQAETPAPVQPSTEVTLSRDALESASQNRDSAAAQNPPDNPPVTEPVSSNQTTPEVVAEPAREAESRQQANQAAQSQTTTSTHTANVAAQSYYSVSNF